MSGSVPPNYGIPDHSHIIPAEAEAAKIAQSVQGGRDWVLRQANEEQRRRAIAAAGRIAVEQTTQR
jgi:hypothetical protein